MKNAQEAYINLRGDVFMRYVVSADAMSETEAVKPGFFVINTSEKSTTGKEVILCYPAKSGLFTDKAMLSGYHEDFGSNFNLDGTLTRAGVVDITRSVAHYLEGLAEKVWSNIDPRCGPRVPSRLYRNVATICADALCHLGIPAKVRKMPLDPEKNNGLKNQYRVVVSARVPVYPWTSADSDKKFLSPWDFEQKWDNINFDFDVTNVLRIKWVWDDGAVVLGDDARELRNGRPVKWVGFINNIARPLKITFITTFEPNSTLPKTKESQDRIVTERTSITTVPEDMVVEDTIETTAPPKTSVAPESNKFHEAAKLFASMKFKD